MKKCPVCNAEIDDNSNFCIYCMTVLNVKHVITPKKRILPRQVLLCCGTLIMLILFSMGIFSIPSLIKSKTPNAPHSTTENPITDSNSSEETESQSKSWWDVLNINFPSRESDNSHSTVINSSETNSEPSTLTSSENSEDTSSTLSSDNSNVNSSLPSSSKNEDNSSSVSLNNSNATSSVTSSTKNENTISSEVSSTTSSEKPSYSHLKYSERTSYPYGIVITDCDENFSGALTIPSTINGKKVTVIGQGAFRDCKKITSVSIPSSVTIIENTAFYSCTSLSSISIPNSVTSIGTYAFYDCEKLKSVTLPSKLRGIQDAAFEHCSSLTSIKIPATVVGVSSSAFWGCKNLSTVYYGGDATKREAISIAKNNEYLINANWKYNAY